MARTITSYDITPITGQNIPLETPMDCQFARVAAGGLQLLKITLTAFVDPSVVMPGYLSVRTRQLRTRLDGEAVGATERYIGSVQIVARLWHVFEVL